MKATRYPDSRRNFAIDRRYTKLPAILLTTGGRLKKTAQGLASKLSGRDLEKRVQRDIARLACPWRVVPRTPFLEGGTEAITRGKWQLQAPQIGERLGRADDILDYFSVGCDLRAGDTVV